MKTKLTRQQITALRAFLGHKGNLSERMDAAIDACRSPAYHAAMLVYRTECAVRRDLQQASDDIPVPVTERVPGSPELRTWLGKEWSRIVEIAQKRDAARAIPETRPLMDRMEDQVRSEFRAAAREAGYRRAKSSWAGGDHTVSVKMVTKGYEFAAGGSERVWSSNGKWSGNNSIHSYGVSRRWRLDVASKGLALVNGCLTLRAEPVDADELRPGEEAYEILYVTQGRGFALETKEAILYRRKGTEWSRATSLAGARRRVAGAGQVTVTSEARP